MTNRETVVVGIIPARLAATRLPNKPLLDICGKPMIQHVWERASSASRLSQVFVATPDPEIAEIVSSFGGTPLLTSASHRSGTDRLAEAVQQTGADIVVNIQGDEPLIMPSFIDSAVEPLLQDNTTLMSSLMCECPAKELDNPSTVKVVCSRNGSAMYFSRSRIPHRRGEALTVPVMQHVGLYAYRREFLGVFSRLAPTPLEITEALEQLRVLEHGYSIRMVQVDSAPLSVDTFVDLELVRRIMATGA